MSNERIQGVALIVGALALLATGLMHPTGEQLLASAEGFAQYATTNVLAHSFALLGVWLTAFGAIGVASRLGLRQPAVMAGLVAYGLAATLICMAAVVDGFVATRLAGDFIGTRIAAERDQLSLLMTFCFHVASSLSRVYVTAMAVALLLWSWAAWRTGFDRVLPWLGVAIATIALAAQLTGHLRMNVHDVMLLAAGQGAWLVWAGIALCRSRPAAPAT